MGSSEKTKKEDELTAEQREKGPETTRPKGGNSFSYDDKLQLGFGLMNACEDDD